MSYTFVTETLDEAIEKGAVGGPTFLTTVMQLASGNEKRNQEWSLQRLEWDISYGIQTPDQLSDVEALFYICGGRFSGFLFQDWSDYQLPNDLAVQNPSAGASQSIGTGNGSNLIFQIYKSYTISSYTYQRPITRPQSGTLLVYVGGVLKTETVDYTVDYTKGVITFVSAPGMSVNVSVICTFFVPVRFNTDAFKKKVTWAGAEEVPAISIVELKEFSQ